MCECLLGAGPAACAGGPGHLPGGGEQPQGIQAGQGTQLPPTIHCYITILGISNTSLNSL